MKRGSVLRLGQEEQPARRKLRAYCPQGSKVGGSLSMMGNMISDFVAEPRRSPYL